MIHTGWATAGEEDASAEASLDAGCALFRGILAGYAVPADRMMATPARSVEREKKDNVLISLEDMAPAAGLPR